MARHDPLGDRMKLYESTTRITLPRRTYTILRVDGRAFHTYLRSAHRPFDIGFMKDMDEVAKVLCEQISGAAFAYAQSDEISVLMTDFATPSTLPWFGAQIQKIVSVAASTAAVTLARRRPDGVPTFDARVFTIADPVEVANYFIWRQQDAVRNSISMAAQAHFSHRQLHGANSSQMQQMLWEQKKVNWNHFPDGAKRGRVVVREYGNRAVTYRRRDTGESHTRMCLRSWWSPEAAPHFTVESMMGGFVPILGDGSEPDDAPAV